MRNFIPFFFALFLISGCTYVTQNPFRSPSSESRVYERPEGLTGSDLADFEHLSEGADIYPYEWFKALRSVTYKDKQGNPTNPYYADFKKRFGILPSPNLKNKEGKTYLMPHVGLTAAWSNHPPESSDAFAEDEMQIIRNINGIKSIKMVGTNCALCHSGAIEHNGQEIKIDGSPSITNVRAFFVDLSKSTVALLAKEELMVDFLKRFNVKNPEANAKELRSYFCKRLGETTNTFFNAGCTSGTITLIMAKVFGDNNRFFRGKEAISDSLLKLLKLTYGFTDKDNLGDLPARMKFLGTLMVGTDPKKDETISGYNRTDAFGRIGNLVLRNDDPISYTAPVSLPFIWGIKYMAMLHYSANSNSVILRNVGQSLGLGAIILSKDLDTTVNVYNLNRLESLVHKIKVPEWEKVLPQTVPEFKINQASAMAGQKVYENNCAKCHESNRFVGPSQSLRDYKMIPLDHLKTDENAARNAVISVGQVRFEDSIFQGVGGIKARYYQKYNITEDQQAEMEYRSLRGNEFFRDTLNGFSEADQNKFKNNYGQIQPGMGYKARHLSGIWATAPFLHNGSVPTLWDLLQPAAKRPKIFNVESMEYDPVRLGFKYVKPAQDRFGHCVRNDERCFDTSISGNHNTGHEYGTVSLTDAQKMQLIEYLKVLPPESEYSWY